MSVVVPVVIAAAVVALVLLAIRRYGPADPPMPRRFYGDED